MANGRIPRAPGVREAAEAVFKPAPKPVETPKAVVIPGARELVSLRLDQDVVVHFQAGGAGWQERMNQALRAAAGL